MVEKLQITLLFLTIIQKYNYECSYSEVSSNKQQHNTIIRFLAASGWIQGTNTKIQI